MGQHMDLLAVMQQLKALQMKPNKSPADEAKIKELQAALLKPQPKDPKAPPTRTPMPSRPGASPPTGAAPSRPAPPVAAKPVAPRPAAPASPAPPRPPAGVPDADAFKLNVKGLSVEDGEEAPEETDAAKTTHEIGDADIGEGRSGGDAFSLQVPDDLEKIDLPEDEEGGVRHEV